MPTALVGQSRRRRLAGSQRLTLTVACGGQFMVILDAAIVNVALPAIQEDLGFAPAALAWVVNGYLLTFAGLMLVGGRAADLFGHRRTFLAGITLFAGASLVAAFAGTPLVLVAARLMQGAGGALTAPATLAAVNAAFEGPARARAFAAWSAAGGVGGMAGALVGGALTTGLSWRWVFLINAPIGAMLAVVALVTLPRLTHGSRTSLDLIGALLGTAALSTLVYGVMAGAEQPWTSPAVLVSLAAGVVLLAAFLRVEARGREPILPLRLFRVRSVTLGASTLLLFGTITMAMWYFTAFVMEDMLNYSALVAGLGQTPAAAAFVLTARRAAVLLPRLGERRLTQYGCSALVVGFIWLSRIDVECGYVVAVLLPTVVVAVGIGLTFPTFMAVATSDAPTSDIGVVSGVASAAGQVGGAVGLAALAAVARSGYEHVFLTAAGVAAVLALASGLLGRRSADAGARRR